MCVGESNSVQMRHVSICPSIKWSCYALRLPPLEDQHQDVATQIQNILQFFLVYMLSIMFGCSPMNHTVQVQVLHFITAVCC